MVIDEVELEAEDTSDTSALELSISGRSPYNGTLPWLAAVELHRRTTGAGWHTYYISEIQVDGKPTCNVQSPHGFEDERALKLGFSRVLNFQLDVNWARDVASLGYRIVRTPTRGGPTTVTLLADRITQLDAAMQLDATPEYIFDLLDAGEDPMRRHAKFGVPYQLALERARRRPDYMQVVEYMRVYGAHT